MARAANTNLTGWRMPEAAKAPWNNLREQRTNSEGARAQSAREIVDRAKAERTTTSDYAGRYPIELVQNAHDAAGRGGRPGRAWVQVTDTALIVANDGEPFDEERVTSLMRYGDSSKVANKSDTTEIGYKGIGFSAVFDVTDNPQILSGPYGFQMHRHRAREAVEEALGVPVERVPVRGYPLELTPAEVAEDLEVIQGLFAEGAVTVIRLPFLDHVSAEAVDEACSAGLGRRTLLFLPKLAHLALRGPMGTTVWSRRLGKEFPQGRVMHLTEDDDRESWLVARTTVPVAEAEVARLANDVWADVRSLNLAVAVPWAGSHPAPPAEPQQLHVYFPTEVELGRGVIVHGDFFVDSSRKHLLQDANCGPLNDRLAAEAGRLAASLVADLVETSGPAALELLDKLGAASPFAQAIWSTTIAALRDEAFVPTRLGDPQRPAATNLLPGDAWVPPLIRAAIADAPGRVLAEYEEHPAVVRVLLELGVSQLSVMAIPGLLTPGAVDANYGDWLEQLEGWLGKLSGQAATAAIAALRKRLVVQRDRDGAWVAPSSVVRREDGIPKLPAYAHRDEVRSHPAGPALYDRLNIELIDLAGAVDLVLDDLAKLHDTRDSHRQAALRFVHQAWNADPRGLATATDRLGEVLVPVRPAEGAERSDEEFDWLPARIVYFDDDWVPNSTARAIYGPLEVAEFLAVEPPVNSSTRSQHLRFYRAIGVDSNPHLMAAADAASAATIRGWHSSGPWQATRCPDHGTARLTISGTHHCIERLDQVLAHSSDEGLAALRRYLLRRDPVLGPKISVRCTHGYHQGRGTLRSAESLDQWLLRTSAWLPVIGSDERSSPDTCWTAVIGSAADLAIKVCVLDERAARQLGVQSFAEPRPEALERELNRLAANSDHTDADQAWDTGRALVRKLAAALRSTRASRPAPRLPVLIGGERSWSAEPVVADMGSVGQLPGLAVLDAPGAAQLRRVYGLRAAADVVRDEVVVAGVHRGRRMLTNEVKAQLVAVLHADGADLVDLARWLGRLEEVAATGLVVRLTHGDDQVDIDEQMYLKVFKRREGSTTVKRGTLSWTNWDLKQASQLLSQYLEDDGRHSLIAFVLTAGDTALDVHGIGPAELTDARAAIERYTPEDSEIDEQDSDEPGDEDRGRTHGTSGADGGDDNEPADSATGTGESQDTGEGSGHGSRSRASGSSDSSPGGGGSSSGGNGGGGPGSGSGSSQQGGGRSGASGRGQGSGSTPEGDQGGRRARRPPRRDRERRRLLSYVLGPSDRGESSTSTGNETRSQLVGERGELVVMDYERAAGRTPERQPRGNPGFDIRSSGGARDRIIEVKAIDGPWTSVGVGLTRREHRAATDHGADYYLYVVEYALDDHPLITEIRDPANRIDRYFFDDQWRQIAELPEMSAPEPAPAWLQSSDGVERPVPIWQANGPLGEETLGYLPYDETDWDPTWFGVIIADRTLGPHYRDGLGIYLRVVDQPDDGDLVLIVSHEGGGRNQQPTHRRVEYQLDEDDDGNRVRIVLVADSVFADPAPLDLCDAQVLGVLQRRLLRTEVDELLERAAPGD